MKDWRKPFLWGKRMEIILFKKEGNGTNVDYLTKWVSEFLSKLWITCLQRSSKERRNIFKILHKQEEGVLCMSLNVDMEKCIRKIKSENMLLETNIRKKYSRLNNNKKETVLTSVIVTITIHGHWGTWKMVSPNRSMLHIKYEHNRSEDSA